MLNSDGIVFTIHPMHNDPEYMKNDLPQCGLFERDTNPISQEIHVQQEREVGIQEYKLMVH